MTSPPRTPSTTGHHGGFLSALRLTKGVINATDAELTRSVESCECAALWGAVAVVAGLVAEVVFAVRQTLTPIAWGTPTETWGAVIADSLVALGVSAEVFFSRLGMNRQRELQRRSDAKLGEATERAATLHKRASDAELEIAKLQSRTSAREIKDRTAFMAELKDKLSPLLVELSYPKGTSECWYIAYQLKMFMMEAKWRVDGPNTYDPGDSRFISAPPISISGRSPSSGIRIWVNSGANGRPVFEQMHALVSAIDKTLGVTAGGQRSEAKEGVLEVVIFPKV